jgi:hypothetical protein
MLGAGVEATELDEEGSQGLVGAVAFEGLLLDATSVSVSVLDGDSSAGVEDDSSAGVD